MTIIERMRAQLTQAMKARDTVKMGFLRYWIAQLTSGSGDELPEADAIKKMRSVLKESKAGPTSFSPAEIELIKEWVPPTLSREQISEALVVVRDKIKAAPKDGMAMGIAMKTLSGQPVESDDVKAAVASLRQ
jgi:uncharacterized protein YqeY